MSLSCLRVVLFRFRERQAWGLLLFTSLCELALGEWPDCASLLSHYYCGWKKTKKGEVGIVNAYPQEKEAEKGGRTDADT